jgi:hypothetical protein
MFVRDGFAGQPDINSVKAPKKLPMHGDIIMFNGKRCVVSITGCNGSYCRDPKTGRAINVAQGTDGFLRDIDDPQALEFRASWRNDIQILVRLHPQMF